MIDIKKYIDTGVLELYVFGNLSEAESREVSSLVAEHPEIREEVEHIEEAMIRLSRAAAPSLPKSFESTFKDIQGDSPVIPLSRKDDTAISRKHTPWKTYLQIAAAALLIGTIGFQIGSNQKLKNQLVDIQEKQILLETQAGIAEERLAETNRLLDRISDKNIIRVPLGAQAVDPDAYASVFWDDINDKAYVDVSGLPQPPEGKVYQVWSLTLEPLTPISLGVIDGYNSDGAQIFELDNPNASQAFGITLEPEGGSESPTMEQLYTLGVVAP